MSTSTLGFSVPHRRPELCIFKRCSTLASAPCKAHTPLYFFIRSWKLLAIAESQTQQHSKSWDDCGSPCCHQRHPEAFGVLSLKAKCVCAAATSDRTVSDSPSALRQCQNQGLQFVPLVAKACGGRCGQTGLQTRHVIGCLLALQRYALCRCHRRPASIPQRHCAT